MRSVHFTFDDSLVYEGVTDDTRWNGFLNVQVTAAVREVIVADFEAQWRAQGMDAWSCDDYVRGSDTIPVECGMVNLSGGFATTEATCDCGHLSGDHQTGNGAWTGFCSGSLGTMNDGYDLIVYGADPDEPCKCEGPTFADSKRAA